MTAKDVSVGLTYLVKVSDEVVPVTLTRECNFGGWYGKNNVTGHSVRIKTAQRLRAQCKTDGTLIHTDTNQSEEDTNMATNRHSVSAADRRARRGISESSTATVEAPAHSEPTAAERLDMALSNARSNVTAKPAAAKRAPARRASKPVVTPESKPETPAKVPTNESAPYGYKKDGTPRKRPVPTHLTNAKTETIQEDTNMSATDTTADVQALAAEMARAMVAELLAANNLVIANPVQEDTTVNTPKPRTRKPAAAKADTAKALTVTLKEGGARKNSWYFTYQGTSKTPLVTGCYVSNEVVEAFENPKTKSLTTVFDVAVGKKHAVLFREADGGTAFNGSIYIKRDGIKDAIANLPANGETNGTSIAVTLTVKSEDEITLSVVAI